MAASFGSAVYLLYGLSFFVLGLLALWVSRYGDRTIPLLRHFQPLGWFGITHGIVEWYTLILRYSLPLKSSSVPYLGLIAITAVSFIFLLRFGLLLLISQSRAPRRMRHISPFLFLTFVCFLSAAFVFMPDSSGLEERLSMVARLALGFPATLVVAAGLYRSSEQTSQLLGSEVSGQLVSLATVFLIYGVLAGLIYDASIFFRVTGFPIELLRTAAAIAATVLFAGLAEEIRRNFDRQVYELRRREILREERDRVGRELHDRVIQVLFAASLQLENAADSCLVDESPHIRNVQRCLNETVRDIRGFIEEGREGLVTGSELAILFAERCRMLQSLFHVKISSFVGLKEIRSRRLPVTAIEDLMAILTEATANAWRHGQALSVDCRAATRGKTIEFTVSDHGTGFDPENVPEGDGIRSMRTRAQRIGGKLGIVSSPTGTLVSVRIPYSQLIEAEDE